MDSFGKIIEILVTTALLFLLPIYYLSLQQDAVCQSQVRTTTSYFVDSVRNQGYMTRNMYELFLQELDSTGQVYRVELTYYKKIEVSLDPSRVIKKSNRTSSAWWLRSANSMGNARFLSVDKFGEKAISSANNPNGVSCAFRIG